VPLALKIAPDLEDAQIQAIADLLRAHHVDAVVATNTTVARSGVEGLPNAEQAGGLSGAPLLTMATAVVKKLSTALAGEVPIIGVGGIISGADAGAKTAAGARLVQVYTGFIYRGPELVAEAATAIAAQRRP
jgi:dihydroorotate dehydrogenase